MTICQYLIGTRKIIPCMKRKEAFQHHLDWANDYLQAVHSAVAALTQMSRAYLAAYIALQSPGTKAYLDLVVLTLEAYAVMAEQKGVTAFQHLVQPSLVQQGGIDERLGA